MIKWFGVDERLQSTIVEAYCAEDAGKSTQNFPSHRYLGKIEREEHKGWGPIQLKASNSIPPLEN